MTRIYTRIGDRGTTRLAGGQEVPKDDVRVAAYGTVDELTSVLGVIRAFVPTSPAPAAARERLDQVLHDLQRDLFRVATVLAVIGDRPDGTSVPAPSDAGRIERLIDAFDAELPPLRTFLLPAGGPVPALLHQARTVSRRAERMLVTLARTGAPDASSLLPYANRLSDLLFVLARWVARAEGLPEVPPSP
ncbi:MAG: cob(I)yrinic acid a,c-diamide adenosyltransferase [Deltaproteobacteria bacterium]|nr:cob(I)yrinic acid a,c-diamide adenosyltransferase [Deltaproteobacteria bacterium]